MLTRRQFKRAFVEECLIRNANVAKIARQNCEILDEGKKHVSRLAKITDLVELDRCKEAAIGLGTMLGLLALGIPVASVYGGLKAGDALADAFVHQGEVHLPGSKTIRLMDEVNAYDAATAAVKERTELKKAKQNQPQKKTRPLF